MPLASLLMHPVSAGGLDAVVLSCGVGFKNQCQQPFGSCVHDLVFHPDAGEVLVAHKRPTLNDCDFHSTPSNTTSYAPCERVADLREIYSLRNVSWLLRRPEVNPCGKSNPVGYPLPPHVKDCPQTHVPPLSLQAGKPRSTPRACLGSSDWCSFSVPNKFVKHHTFCRLFFA